MRAVYTDWRPSAFASWQFFGASTRTQELVAFSIEDGIWDGLRTSVSATVRASRDSPGRLDDQRWPCRTDCALEHAHCHVAQSQTLSPVSVHVRPAFCCCSRRISIEPRSREAKGDFIRRGRQRSPAQKSARLVLSSVIATRSPEQRYNQGIFRQVQSARCVGSEKGSSVMRILGKV